ncbi:hypothetical protein D3C84_1249960 [compost metagenome]
MHAAFGTQNSKHIRRNLERLAWVFQQDLFVGIKDAGESEFGLSHKIESFVQSVWCVLIVNP